MIRRARLLAPAFEAARYFPALDGMRAFCVLMVMFNHIPEGTARPSWMYGYRGVDIFFVLSGFLITTLMIRERARTGTVSLKAFYLRRFFRIVPVYAFTVALYFAAVYVTHDEVKITQFNAALPWLLTFMQEYRPVTAGNILGHAWTLGIEEKFYLIWPVLFLAVCRSRSRSRSRSRGRGWLWATAVSLILLSLPPLYSRSYGGLALGSLLAIAMATPGCRAYVEKLSRVPDGVLCALVLATYFLAGRYEHYVLLFSASIALLIASCVARDGWLRRLLEHPALVYIGQRSYSMYLIHVLVANAVGKLTTSWLPATWPVVVTVIYAGSLMAAALLYVAIERPGKRLGAWLLRDAQALPAVRTATDPS